MSRWILAAAIFLSPLVAQAQQAPPIPAAPIVIDQVDLDEVREIILSTVPTQYQALLIRWHNRIVQRAKQQAEQRQKEGRDEPPK